MERQRAIAHSGEQRSLDEVDCAIPLHSLVGGLQWSCLKRDRGKQTCRRWGKRGMVLMLVPSTECMRGVVDSDARGSL